MKAEVAQQVLLVELAELDAELSRLDHRVSHLPEQQQFEQLQADQRSAELVAKAIGCAVIPMDALDKDPVKNLDVMAEKIGAASGSLLP